LFVRIASHNYKNKKVKFTINFSYFGCQETLWQPSDKNRARLSRRFAIKIFSMSFPQKAKIGDVFSWSEVAEIHRVRNGVYQRGGRLISLLTDFGRINPCYPDFHGDSPETIFYTGAGRRGDQKLDSFNRALFDTIESGHEVPLFNKLEVGRWQFTGFWRVIDGKYVFDAGQNRMIWQFTLRRIDENA
jgi:hypothetical protein